MTTAARLPSGRHGLSREAVASNQRERLLRALAEAMARKGYVATTVADVLREAGVSRETFYEQFRSKEDLFVHALDAAAGILLGGVQAAGGADGDPMARFDRALRAYLDALADEPAFARLFLVEVHVVPDGLARRAAAQAAFTALLVDLFDARTDEARFACEALVAATSAMVTARIAADDLDGLRGLHDPLLRLAERLL